MTNKTLMTGVDMFFFNILCGILLSGATIIYIASIINPIGLPLFIPIAIPVFFAFFSLMLWGLEESLFWTWEKRTFIGFVLSGAFLLSPFLLKILLPELNWLSLLLLSGAMLLASLPVLYGKKQVSEQYQR
jgi:hypothetical protein